MKIYKNLEQLKADMKDGVLVVNEDVTFEFSFSIEASLKIYGNINAWNINARNINAWNINARDINARDINAWNINARDINAWNINARDILYDAFCCVYYSIKCISIKAKREKFQEPICLDGKLEFKHKETIEAKLLDRDDIKALLNTENVRGVVEEILKSQRQELIEEIEKEINGMSYVSETDNEIYQAQHLGYKMALKRLLTKLKNQ